MEYRNKILKEWIQGHHKKSDIIQFVTDDDAITDSNEVNIDIQSNFFRKVYNSNVEVDWSILDDLKQELIYSDTNTPLSLFEFSLAIKKLILHTAPGLIGVSSNAFKSYLFRICADSLKNILDIKVWQKDSLTNFHKK